MLVTGGHAHWLLLWLAGRFAVSVINCIKCVLYQFVYYGAFDLSVEKMARLVSCHSCGLTYKGVYF